MSDGTPIIDGLPFVRCDRCDGITTLDDDGLAMPHTTPCGAHCELSPDEHGAGHVYRCNGNCTTCRNIRTGCRGDTDHPCGRKGCGECGVHASDGWGAVCRNARPLHRAAWTWDRVTCEGCHARRRYDEERGEAT